MNEKTCIGCRLGLSPFMYRDEKLIHFDIFRFSMVCQQPEAIKPFLKEPLENGMMFLEHDQDNLFKEREFWLEDISNLLRQVFTEETDQNAWWKEHFAEVNTWSHTYPSIEEELLTLAREKGVEITEEEYPDLFLFHLNKKL